MDKKELNLLQEKAQNLTILYVEDEAGIRERVTIFLQKIFSNIEVAANGQEGLDKYCAKEYDIIITDISMPIMNGLEMIRHIRTQSEQQEIIVLSAYSDAEYFTEAIALNVTGYILKPLNINQTLKVLKQSVNKLTAFRENERYKTKLEHMVQERTKEVIQLQDEKVENYEKAIRSFVKMIEVRDEYTGGHSERVASYSSAIAKEMGCTENECATIYQAGILHDVGKIITPDSILLKPGKLSDQEYKLIKDHVDVGYKILSEIPMYKNIAKIVYAHHERHDGSGYPLGISGDEIPLSARIMALADTFDAMTTSRTYKIKKSIPNAIEEIKTLSGVWFDPEVVKSAEKIFKNVNLDAIVVQEPNSGADEERFAYFYKDLLTNSYNHHYLDFMLQKCKDENQDISLHVLYLKNFSTYNKSHSWSGGDKILKAFANYLQSTYKGSKVFRIFGDDFVLLQKEHKAIDIDEINALEFLKESNLFCHYDNFNVMEKNIETYKELQEA